MTKRKKPNPSDEPQAAPSPAPVVERPRPHALPSPHQQNASKKRSLAAYVKRSAKAKEKFMKSFMKTATKVILDSRFEELKPPRSDFMPHWQEVCDEELGLNRPPIVESSLYYAPGADGLELVLAYFGQRVIGPSKVEAQQRWLTQKTQYLDRTQADLDRRHAETPGSRIVRDGLSSQQCELYAFHCQSLCADLSLRKDKKRHKGTSTMPYLQEPVNHQDSSSSELESFDIDQRYIFPSSGEQHSDEIEDYTEAVEPAGVVHISHGWPQQNQIKKGLFLSGDTTENSTTFASTASHIGLTSDVAAMIAVMFQTAFPGIYKQYKQAFDAGAWFPGEDGPMMARAIIYKLQGVMHTDTNDVGPSVSFGVGKYCGGEMKMPQLGAKFAYLPGDVCIFYSSRILHLVDTFYPLPQTQQEKAQKITPGRIGSVFFFPKASFTLLQGKGPGWALKTAHGRNEHLFPPGTFDLVQPMDEDSEGDEGARGAGSLQLHPT